MDGYTIYSDPALRGKTPWPVIESSLWLRVGFVAFAVAVIALTELYKGDANPLAAIAWIFGGAWVTALSWRRAKVVLDRLDADDATAVAVIAEAAPSKGMTQRGWDRREVSAPQVRS